MSKSNFARPGAPRGDDGPSSVRIVEHAAFVRRLARALLGVGADADDVAQETLVAAWRSDSVPSHDPRGWLTTVVRNAARQLRRRQAARRDRERAAATPDRSDLEPIEALVSVERQRSLLDALASLPSDQREALVTRFLYGHSVADAAERIGVSPETLRSRTRRGLAALRQRLDRDELMGGWLMGGWALWLAPFAGLDRGLTPAVPAAATSALIGGLLVMSKLAVVLLVLSIPLAWHLWPSAMDRPATSEAAAAVQQESRDPARRAAAQIAVAPQAPGRTVLQSSDLATEQPAAAAAPIEVPFEVHFVGLRADGVHVEGLDGELRVGGPSPLRVPIDGGRATLDASARKALAGVDGRSATSVELELELGGGAAYLDPTSRGALLAPAAEGERIIIAMLLEPVQLHVLDSVTGRDLTGVNAIDGWPHSRGDVAPTQVRVQGTQRSFSGDSPLTITPWSPTEGYWVSAPDHAWAYVTLDHVGGGRREVRLEPAGALVVRLLPLPEDPVDVALRLIRHGTSAAGESAGTLMPLGVRVGRDGLVDLGQLATGAWTVRAESFGRDGTTTVLGTVTADVRVGERTTVDLVIEGLARGPRSSIRGVVTLDGVPEADVRLYAIPHGAPGLHNFSGPTGQLLSFENGRAPFQFDVTCGSWELVIDPYQTSVLVDVPPEGAQGVVVDLQALAAVTIRLVERGGATPVETSWLAFTTAEDFAHNAGSVTMTTVFAVAGEPGVYRFQVPVGSLVLGGRFGAYVPRLLTLDVVAPITDQIIEFDRAPGVRIRLVHGTVTVPIGARHPVQVERIGDADGSGPKHFRSIENGRGVLRVNSPGLYRITVAAPDGFLAPEPIEMQFELGGLPDVTIELEAR